jgi:hypothetical protein
MLFRNVENIFRYYMASKRGSRNSKIVYKSQNPTSWIKDLFHFVRSVALPFWLENVFVIFFLAFICLFWLHCSLCFLFCVAVIVYALFFFVMSKIHQLQTRIRTFSKYRRLCQPSLGPIHWSRQGQNGSGLWADGDWWSYSNLCRRVTSKNFF